LPPSLALFAGLCYIAFLLRLDRRQNPEATLALWIPTVWLLIASTKALGTWFGMQSTSIEEGSALDRNVLILLFCIVLGLLLKRKFDFASGFRENAWLLAYLGITLCSVVWSDLPFVSFKRFFRETIPIFMAFLVMTEKDPKEAIATAVRRAVYILIPLSLILIKWFPDLGVDYTVWTGDRMWIGVADQKNELGQLTSLSAFFILWSLLRRGRRPAGPRIRYLMLADLSVLAITLYLMQGSDAGYSATSLVILAVSLICLAGLLWLKKKGRILGPGTIKACVAFVVVYGIITPFLGRLTIIDISSSLGRNSTLTDRTNIWAGLIPQAMSRPVLGHGAGAYWTTERFRRGFPAHNGYLEIILVLGFIGLLLMAIYLVSLAGKAQNLLARDYTWGMLWLCWLTMALVNNITESSLNTFENILIAIPLWFGVVHKRSG